jgi:hypothetical protein
LYRELYYRHIYSRLTPTIEHRFHSYENYCDLFNYILSKKPGIVSIACSGVHGVRETWNYLLMMVL